MRDSLLSIFQDFFLLPRSFEKINAQRSSTFEFVEYRVDTKSVKKQEEYEQTLKRQEKKLEEKLDNRDHGEFAEYSGAFVNISTTTTAKQ